jgi:hypothetical protein
MYHDKHLVPADIRLEILCNRFERQIGENAVFVG